MGDDRLRYDFEVTPNSTYARAARLIASTAAPGVVIDLGAGLGALSETVEPYGFTYVGFDADPANVEAMHTRGRTAAVLDLLADDADERVLDAVRGMVGPGELAVAAIVLLDVVEHLPDPDQVMRFLDRLIDRFADDAGPGPLLVLSIPNVGHVDLASKLLLGRWDVTEVGLLDATHISLFTDERLQQLMARHDFDELARSDVVMPITEQREPPDLPVFGDTSLAELLRDLRDRADPFGSTYQFVRAYRRRTPTDQSRRPTSGAEPSGHEPGGAPFCSVIVRTQGSRGSLVDTLVSLAAQHDPDVEVLVMVHHVDDDVVASVRELAASFEPGFAGRVRVEQVVGGGRSAPLNAALRLATGRFVAVLDDDDVVTSGWISAFKRAARRAPGRMVRAGTVVQWIERRDGELVDFEPVSGFEPMYPPRFDLLDTIRSNRSPPCCYAMPLAAVRALGIEFDDTLRVCEDWKFELDVARHTGVSDDPEVTSVYRRWRGDGGSSSVESTAIWVADHERVVDDLDGSPTVLPPGSLRRLHDLYTRLEMLERELGRRSDDDPPLSTDG